jgi:hypothetical protein
LAASRAAPELRLDVSPEAAWAEAVAAQVEAYGRPLGLENRFANQLPVGAFHRAGLESNARNSRAA